MTRIIREYDVSAQLLQPEEIREARIRLGLTLRGMAEVLLLSGANGNRRVMDWEEGKLPVSGPVSQCIRLWLAVKCGDPAPHMPVDRDRGR
jgi:DNA-binding transcriptional regulator YiaG